MKYCCYCGKPISEPARFCPMCGAQLPSEVFGEALHSIPVEPQPFTEEAPKMDPYIPETIVLTDRIQSSDRWKMYIVAFIALAIIMTGLNHTQASGVEGSWKATADLNEMSALVGEDPSFYSSAGLDTFEITVDLNQDNSMAIRTKMSGGTVDGEIALVGTYEVLSEDTLSLYAEVMESSFSAYGFTENDSEDIDHTTEVNYVLDGNRLTLSNNGIELQLDKS